MCSEKPKEAESRRKPEIWKNGHGAQPLRPADPPAKEPSMTDLQQPDLPPEVGERQQRRLDLAARAAWLYYIAGNTQDQIARKLNVSRQAAQRMVATAVAEGLIKFRLDHPIAACTELAEALERRFELDHVEVVPGT
jgi:hypothetical protein